MDQLINLASGQPAAAMLPADLIAAAAADVLRDASNGTGPNPLNYGDDISVFSERVAQLLMNYDNRPSVNPAHIVPTSGVSHALDALCTLLSRPDRSRKNGFVFVEEATYYLASDVFRDHSLDVRSLAMDEQGPSAEDLERQLEALDPAARQADSSPWPLLLYCIPNFHNPTGRSVSEKRKRQLCEVSARFGLPLVADEVYNLLNYTALLEGPSPACRIPTSMSILGYPNVISISSFSKILAPGLRVGWIEFPSPELATQYTQLGFFRSGSNTSQLSSCIVLKTMEQTDPESGQPVLMAHVNRLRAAYARRYTALVGGIARHSAALLPAGERNQLTVEGAGDPERPVGGYFVWLKLPVWATTSPLGQSTDPDGIVQEAKEKYNLVFRLGGECAPVAGLHGGRIRLVFAKLSESELEEGARRLCALLRSIYDKNHTPL